MGGCLSSISGTHVQNNRFENESCTNECAAGCRVTRLPMADDVLIMPTIPCRHDLQPQRAPKVDKHTHQSRLHKAYPDAACCQFKVSASSNVYDLEKARVL